MPLRSHRRSLLLATAASLLIAEGATAATDADRISLAIERAYPGARATNIAPSPIPGLFEALVGTHLLYVTPDGKKLIDGQVIDLTSKTDLTAKRLETLLAILPESLPAGVISRKQGSGRRHITVFADPQCGYCRQLEKTLDDVRDITVNTVIIPVLGDPSKDLARRILCAADPGKAWRDHMSGVSEPAANSECAAAEPHIKENLQFASTHGIAATPTIIMPDGTRIQGARGAAELSQRLDEARPSRR